MRARDVFPVMIALVAAGCASTTAPKNWLPRATEAQSETHGGWISLREKVGPHKKVVHEGELIAVQADSVFVLEAGGCAGLPTSRIENAMLMGYDADTGPLSAWTTLGVVSALSHGYGFVISGPVWILVGVLATSAQSNAPQVTVTPATWEKAREYARFPQGIPAGLDRSSLRPKPLPGG